VGLFRRGSRKRAKAAANLGQEQTPGIVQPAAGIAEATAGTAEAKVASREVTAETRPDPDKPGWGRIVGQTIGKSREDRQE
jgi:hypothetical protein